MVLQHNTLKYLFSIAGIFLVPKCIYIFFFFYILSEISFCRDQLKQIPGLGELKGDSVGRPGSVTHIGNCLSYFQRECRYLVLL